MDDDAPGATSSSDGGISSLVTTRVYAAGICCAMEVPLVQGTLRRLPGVHSVSAPFPLASLSSCPG